MPVKREIPHIHKFLLPCACLYNVGIWCRNKLFDYHVLPSQQYEIPIISVGNLTVGGTGKTPMIEYLIELLSQHKRVAVLSRGYRRKSKGYILADADTTASQIGDEPYQIHTKYPHIMVAVDSNRRRGIEQLLHHATPPEVILLDDAHQHRYVQPSLSIILNDYNRPVYADMLMPAGRLREPISGLKRAHVVVLTKCTHPLTREEMQEEACLLGLKQQLMYAAHIEYGTPYNLSDNAHLDISSVASDKPILVLTGIANPQPILEYLCRYTSHITLKAYADHHDFTVQELQDAAQEAKAGNAVIVTTEKDAARIKGYAHYNDIIGANCYVLPMKSIVNASYGAKPFDAMICEAVGITDITDSK